MAREASSYVHAMGSIPYHDITSTPIHKEGNPGRPIISGNGCPTEIISHIVDYHLKDLVRLIPSYVQDNMDFLRKIHNINAVGPLPPDTILCTMDVSALYTNTPHGEDEQTTCRQVTLISVASRYRELIISRTIRSMTLVRRYITQPCIKNFSYGFYGPYAWVSRNCRGWFRICYIPGATRLITCSSRNYMEASICNVARPIKSVTVKYHLSRYPCVLNYSYRVIGTRLQVYNRCRATFAVGY
ncbi:hypothetical protein PoB_001512200 [Plakobranchus ocellatus]|uniref:Uncharacterized protein n=1 Tax=Plakobranchus ocellatus TaxID=259542 RepID=A0AAV3Z261_9GAST|nr:hypothetical protein PoB_001512200 [Plakobranchus ocellatus]